VATVFEVRDEIREVVEPTIPPVKVPERQGRRPVVGRYGSRTWLAEQGDLGIAGESGAFVEPS